MTSGQMWSQNLWRKRQKKPNPILDEELARVPKASKLNWRFYFFLFFWNRKAIIDSFYFCSLWHFFLDFVQFPRWSSFNLDISQLSIYSESNSSNLQKQAFKSSHFQNFYSQGIEKEDLFQYSQLYKYRSYVWVVDRKVIIGLAKVEEGEEEKNRPPIILLFCCDNTIQAMRRYEG